jgi:protein required for attachment to host cells
MPTSPKKTWIVIVDGMHARILSQEQHGAPLVPALDHELFNPAAHGFSRDLKSDAPGRAFDTGSGARHSMEAPTDPKTREKALFARRVADIVNNAAGRKEFQRLILVAPPKILGELRTTLDSHAKALVAGEVHRDLIHTPLSKIPHHLAKVL